MPSFNFFYEETTFRLSPTSKYKTWLSMAIANEGKSTGVINFIFCSDDYLHQLNITHLNHDTFTDVITFDHSEQERDITGDIFISVDRVQENAKNFNVPFKEELQRVMIHGILHLVGYGDKTAEEAQSIRAKEDHYIDWFDR